MMGGPDLGRDGGPVAHQRSAEAGSAAIQKSRRTRILIVSVCALAALAVGGSLTAAVVSGDHQPKQEKKLATATASVERGTLSGSTSVSGTLAYAGLRSIGVGSSGVVTALPAAGTKIGLGQQMFAVDNNPTFLFIGPLPAWRGFESGMDDGPDVKALEESLKTLGYFAGTPDAVFTWSSEQAILDWQKATGQERTGTIPLGTIVFSPEEVRVSDVVANVGDQASPGAPMVKVTDLTKLVNVNLKLSDQTLAVVGAKVTIELPDGKSTTGAVTSVGVPTEHDKDGQKDVVIPVVIALADPAAAGALQQATVTVNFPTEKRENVLSVPVEALLALGGNTFGVEVVYKNGTTTKVPVKTGLFAAGRVEISGDGIAEGQKVVVPKL